MSQIIQYGDVGHVDWTGQDNMEINIRPMFIDRLPQELGFRVIHSVKSKHRLHFFGNMRKVLMPYAKGFQGGKQADKLQKELYLKEFKAEASYDKHDYADQIWYEIVNKGGINQNDITGTNVADAERKIFFDALFHDVIRLSWLGDTDKVHTDSGEYNDGSTYAIGDPDKNYNQIDGILKTIRSNAALNPTDNEIKRIVMPNVLATDDVEGLMEQMLWESNDVLRKLQQKSELVFFATKDVIKNYRETILSDGTDAARVEKMNGVNVYKYDGIPMYEIPVHMDLANDFPAVGAGAANGEIPKDYLILTTPQNMALVVNSQGSFAETKFWFNPDENENRQRTQFEMGVDYILPELITACYADIA